jgi:pimeloyl-ACP methyl ester carboxylesterase
MRTVVGLLLAGGALAVAAGCAEVNYTSAERYERGLVVCLGGAGGMMMECDRVREGLASGGVDRAIEIFEWSRGGVIADQADVAENRRRAGQLARRIEAYLQEFRGRPVHLVGVSAGTGLVVWALEELDGDDKVTGAVLISSSLDTKYDLTRALDRVTDHLYSFSSVADTVLSLGVTWTGTVDRNGGLAAGLFGFSMPDNAPEHSREVYKDKLAQIGWWPGDMILGHLGDHLGATSPLFVRARISPMILGRKPERTGAPEPVKADEPKALPVSGRLAEGRRTDLMRRDWRAAAAAAAPAPETRKADRRAAKEDKPRFFDWNVGGGANRPVDESQFFTESGRLP